MSWKVFSLLVQAADFCSLEESFFSAGGGTFRFGICGFPFGCAGV
jgi:hypothetical protein